MKQAIKVSNLSDRHDLVIAVGDIHGRADCLASLQAGMRDEALRRGAKSPAVVYLGDYCDRGPQTPQAIDLIIDGLPGWHVTTLMGNHDQMFAAAIADKSGRAMSEYMGFSGAISTLASYGVPFTRFERQSGIEVMEALQSLMTPRHRDFFECLVHRAESKDAHFVHAGFYPGVPVTSPKNNDEVMLWIREPFLDTHYNYGKPVFHGHTPNKTGPTFKGYRVGCDTMAFRTAILTGIVVSDGTVLTGTPSVQSWVVGLLSDRITAETRLSFLAWSLNAAAASGARQVDILVDADSSWSPEFDELLCKVPLPSVSVHAGESAGRKALGRHLEAIDADDDYKVYTTADSGRSFIILDGWKKQAAALPISPPNKQVLSYLE